jgi:beta-ribofuranosylaminobenzene 5'-phosphate synthase
MSQVTVTTGARLHFGLLAHAPKASRQFGGVGLMVERPGFQVSVSNVSTSSFPDDSPIDAYSGPPDWRHRVLDVVRHCRERSHDRQPPFRAHWELTSTIPSHIGLGSGTQLGLAVAQAWTAFQHGEAESDATKLAGLAGRGLRSALGIHGFQLGGLLVEAGKRSSEQISPIVARADFPAEWRIVLICPRGELGLSGTAEITAFAALPAMSNACSAELCRIVLMELLPAVHEADFAVCSDALFRFGWMIGEYFAPAQGGVFASRRMAKLVDWLRQNGIAGVGQSSWGPMLFSLCPDAITADALQADLRASDWGDCDTLSVAGKNSGAKIQYKP